MAAASDRLARARWAPLAAAALLVALGFWAFAVFHFGFERRNDYTKHVVAAQRWLRTGEYHPHFLYHLLLLAGSGFSGEVWSMRRAGVAIATLALAGKLTLSALLLRRWGGRDGRELAPGALGLLLLALGLAAPIVNWWSFPRVYLGQLSPTIWHNPTVILGMPLWLGVIALLRDERDRALMVFGSLLLAGSVFAKPHFALALLPALAVLAALRRLRVGTFLLYAAPAGFCLLLQLAHGQASGTVSPIALRPMAVWSSLSPHPLASLLLSLAFPALVALCFGRRVRERRVWLLAWLLFGVSLALFALFAEGGRRMAHGNFYWGTVPSLYLLFLVSAAELARLWERGAVGAQRWRQGLCAGALALHVASGVLFYVRTLLQFNWRA